MGLLGLSVPEAYGGCSQGHLYLCLAVEEIARVCASSSLIVQVQSLGWEPILIGGSEDQKQHYGPPVASGSVITAYGLTEPGAGSDTAAIQTTAVLDANTNEWVLNGEKIFITGGQRAMEESAGLAVV